MDYELIVIGAGTSGLMAAISASSRGIKTLLIEKNKKVGRKLLLSGGRRCNVTNSADIEELIKCLPRNGKFLYDAFKEFNNKDIIKFFEDNGVELKEEDNGRIFPKSDEASTIVNALYALLLKFNVKILFDSKVENLFFQDSKLCGVVLQNGKIIKANSVIVATGGKAYPHTGSSGDGYKFAKACSHNITKLFASEAPLISNDDFIKDKTLQGLSLKNAKLSLINSKKKIVISHEMDFIFTHFGLSGPAALRLSMFINQELEKNDKALVKIDALPALNYEDIKNKIKNIQKEQGNKSIKNALKNFLTQRYLVFLLNKANINIDKDLAQMTNKELDAFINLIKNFEINIVKTWPLQKAFVTCGGIDLKQINPKTMESKIVQNLYFVGEVIDINGYTGGYNITVAFTTGFVAGKNITKILP